MSEIHALYRIYNASGDLLYVGITANPPARFRVHERKQWWAEVARIDVEHHASRGELHRAEEGAIRAEHPLYNVAHNCEPRLVEYAGPEVDATHSTLADWFRSLATARSSEHPA